MLHLNQWAGWLGTLVQPSMSDLIAKGPLRSWSLNQLVISTSNSTVPISCTFPTCHRHHDIPNLLPHQQVMTEHLLCCLNIPTNNSAMVMLYYTFFKLGKRWRIKWGIFYLRMMCFQYGWRCWWDDRSEEALLSVGGEKKEKYNSIFQAFFFSPHSLIWGR